MFSIIGCTIKPKKSVPEDYVAGQKYFHQVCANCHGVDEAGGNKAPTFLQEKFLPTNFTNGKIAKTILNVFPLGQCHHKKIKLMMNK